MSPEDVCAISASPAGDETNKHFGPLLLITTICIWPELTISRLTIVSREAKKKQAVRDEQVSYLHVAPL